MTHKERDALVLVRAGKLTIPILEREKVHLVMNYGSDDGCPSISPPDAPKTVEESLIDAADFVTDLGRRGYLVMKGVDPKRPRTMFDRSLQHASSKQNPKALHASIDSYQDVREFLNWEVVRTIEGEIHKLPYFVNGNDLVMVQKLRDGIAAVARGMIADRQFDMRKLNRRQILQSTMKFVRAVKDERTNVLKWGMSMGHVDLAKIPPNSPIRKEFPEFWSRPRPVEPVEPSIHTPEFRLDRRLGDYLDATAPDFPGPYRVTRKSLEEARNPPSDKVFQTLPPMIRVTPTVEAVPAHPSPVSPSRARRTEVITLPRPEPVAQARQPAPRRVPRSRPPPPPSLLSIAPDYWMNDDPLGAARMGRYVDPLDSLHNLARPVGVASRARPLDFKFDLWSLPEEEIEATPDVPETIESPVDLDSELHFSPRAPKRPDHPQLPRSIYVAQFDDKSAFSYLEQHTADFEPDRSSDAIYAQFERIWTSLGFSLRQKLDMVLKYSKSPELSVRLSEALLLWQKAYDCIEVYQRCYSVVKDFLRVGFATIPADKRPQAYLDCERELHTAERQLREVADQLKTSYEDDLVFKRHKLEDVLTARKAKLSRLKNDTSMNAAAMEIAVQVLGQ
jgi:hypothetical protein